MTNSNIEIFIKKSYYFTDVWCFGKCRENCSAESPPANELSVHGTASFEFQSNKLSRWKPTIDEL